MGLNYGADCIGASWALMAALFALGVMSLTWMTVVATLIAAERLLPRPARPVAALVLIVLGAGVATAPARVPGLTLPGAAPMQQMQMQMR
jgi:predicted metal-binding membrane protein